MRLAVHSLAYGGEGVGRLPDGRTVFVPGACPDEVLEVRVTEEHPRYVRAQIESIVEASPARVQPPCPYFGECGGCQWQHVAYDTQTAAKRTAISDALERIGGIRAESLVGECIASRETLGYRNKIELHASHQAGGLTLGFAALGDVRVIPVDRCLLATTRAQDAPKALNGALRFLSGRTDLGLERVALRISAHSRDLEVALWTRPGPFPRKLAATTLRQAVGATSVVRVLTTGPAAERIVKGVEVLTGKGFWRERLAGRAMVVSAPSFFQVNTAAAESLLTEVMSAAAPNPSARILDVYAGVGTFSIPLAERAGEVVAVESSSHAIADLRRNADAHAVDIDIAPGDAARAIAELGAFDVAIVDPPRSGLARQALNALAGTRPERIVYVSCDPATLARDAALLGRQGYGLRSARPVDLFPQTYHVETVALFARD